jgi:predicted DNA-binding protein with PD1-like motif
MNLTPKPCCRGDSLGKLNGNIVGAIGGFSAACVNGQTMQQPFEVLLVQGNPQDGFLTRLGDSHHRVYEGHLTESTVSFTLEAFETEKRGDPLPHLVQDSASLQFSASGDLHHFVLNEAARHNLQGALIHIAGMATELHTYGHTDPLKLNDQTKTFDHPQGQQLIEGWGNLSLIDGNAPFVHIYGTYEGSGGRRGGHFIMDEKTHLIVEKVQILIFPVTPIIRKIQREDFPTWLK